MAKVFKNPISEEYAKKWHPTLNGDLTPADYSAGSKVKVHWLCEKTGHSYFKSIQDVTKGSGCSVCAGFQVCIGFNDLDAKFPEIAKEWHPTLNGDAKSSDFTYGSHYNAFWLGECGHEFQATINRRVSLGNSCPYCAGQKILIGYNDLPTTHPEIIKQWDYEKNELSPENYTAGTNKKVYWVGDCGHSFLNAVSEKIRSAETDADGCPYCVGKKVLKGFNDLDSQYPAIAKEWSPNNKKRADEVSCKAVTPSLWICPEGHEYKTPVRQRTLTGSGCLYCSGMRVIPGVNDASGEFPFLVDEWDEVKNHGVSILGRPKSDRGLFWWKCPVNESHSYQATISARVDKKVMDSGCTVCSNRYTQAGINDLCTTHPTVSAEWDYEKNAPLLPTMVSRSYSTKVWWKCSKGHESFKSPSTRISIHGEISMCPACSLSIYSSLAEREIADLLERLGEKVITGNRSLLKGGEIDIYLPEHNLAIEFNGIYWHSLGMNGKTESYHYDKWIACKEAGLELFHVLEDDWKRNKDAILLSIFRKINAQPQKVNALEIFDFMVPSEVEASDLRLSPVSRKQLLGFAEGNSFKEVPQTAELVGMFTPDNTLVAYASFIILDGESVELLDFVSDRGIVGGIGRLSHYLFETYGKPITAKLSNDTPIVAEYLGSGFSVVDVLPAEFCYVVRNIRFVPVSGSDNDNLVKRSQGRVIYDSGYTVVSKEFNNG